MQKYVINSKQLISVCFFCMYNLHFLSDTRIYIYTYTDISRVDPFDFTSFKIVTVYPIIGRVYNHPNGLFPSRYLSI